MLEQDEYEEEASVPVDTMAYGEIGQCYVLLRHPTRPITSAKFACILKFTVKEIDPSTGA